MTPPDDTSGPLSDLVSRLADGEEPDWSRILDETPNPDDQRVIESLRVIGALARAGREEVVTAAGTQSSGSPESPVLRTGQRLGPYEILERIGAGGMGEVYRARQTQLGRDVAIKTLPWRTQVNTDSQRRFEREARLAASLTHRNIVAVHDFCEYDGISFVVQEYLDGSTWRSLIRAGQNDRARAIRMIAEAAAGVAAAHAIGLVHRDIKPDNLFETRASETKVVDFGLARSVETSLSKEQDGMSQGSGTVMGTPSYAAPECLRGEPGDQRSDVFALACAAYELLEGVHPFARTSNENAIAALLREDPKPLSPLPSEAGKALGRMIERALSKAPSARPAAAEIAAAALAASGAKPETAEAPWGPRLRLVAQTLVAGVLLSVVAFAAWRYRPGTPLPVAVIRFETTPAERDLEYVAVALSEGLNGDLQDAPRLEVVSRLLIGQAQGRDPRVAGQTLGAKRVVAGSLLRDGAGLIAEVRILDVASGAMSWQRRFEGSIGDLPAFERSVARGVAGGLGVDLIPATRTSAGPSLQNPEARRLYAEARYFGFRRAPNEMFKAIDLYNRALTLEPDFALAHAGLARTYVDLAIYVHGVSSKETRVVARREAERALAIEPHLARAISTMGDVEASDWNRGKAHLYYQQAIALDPAEPDPYIGEALDILLPAGRFKDAREQLRRGLGLDVSTLTREALGRISYFERDYPRAFREFSEVLEADPAFVSARYRLGQVLLAQGQPEKALVMLREADRQTHGLHKGRALLSYALAAAGHRDEAVEILNAIVKERDTTYVPASLIGLAHTGLGNHDLAFEWLNRGCVERAEWMHQTAIEPLLDPIRKDPRFSQLLRCVGL